MFSKSIQKSLLKNVFHQQKLQRFCTLYTELQRDFLEPQQFYKSLIDRDIKFFSGVPDSLLKDFCGYVADNTRAEDHIITANEGAAVSTAVGYHLATGKIPIVYLQNSGIGNIINPIMSLAHEKVYQIPMLMMIGWRGQPGKHDEPHHMVQGKQTVGLLTEMGIPYEILPQDIESANECIDNAIEVMRNRKTPYALIVCKNTFSSYKFKSQVKNSYPLNREQALEVICELMKSHDATIGTTGFLSRELFELRLKNKKPQSSDFLCVGSMGYASSISLGVALQKPSRNIYCLDGDGACLMHGGSLAVIGQSGARNFKHILFNNEAHDSVGAQPTVGGQVDFCAWAKCMGYTDAFSASTEEEIQEKFIQLKKTSGPVMLEIKIKPGARKDLMRPTANPIQIKQQFIDFLKQ